jgi:hypothetical protein
LTSQCFLNRILSLDPRKFERQLLYHVSNNKQRTISPKKMIRVGDYFGQLLTVKERAEKFIRADAADRGQKEMHMAGDSAVFHRS